MNVNANAVTGALNLDARHACAVERLGEHLANHHVFGNEVGVTLTLLRAVGEPTRHVVGGNSEAEAIRVYFLAHYLASFFGALTAGAALSSGVASTTVMWLVRLRILNARP